MLRSMREGAKSPVMKFFLLFLAAGFALWGVGDISSGLFSSGNKAVRAGDRSVSLAEAATEFERARRSIGQNLTTGEALDAGLLNEVIGTLARRTLYAAEADALGITATRDMQKQAVAQTQSFKDDLGQFSTARFRQVLGQAGLSEQEYLDRLNFVLMQEQIEDAIASNGRAPTILTETLARFQLETRTASIKSYEADLNAVTPPDDSVLAEFYADVKDGYDAPALRSFEVISLTPEAVESQIILDEQEVVEAFELRRDEFVTPERRLVRQMVFEDEQTAQKARSELASGKSFADVATEMLGWTESDSNLGLVAKDDLSDELAEAVFSATASQPVGPVNSVFGFHVILVDNIEPGSEATLADVRTSVETLLRSEKAIDLVYDRVNELEDILGTGATLDEAARKIGVMAGKIDEMDANGRNIDGMPITDSIGDLATDSLFLQQAWNLEIDEISPVIESAQNSFFVVKPVMEADARPRALEEVKTRLIADWTKIQALAKAKADAQTTLQNPQKTFEEINKTAAFSRTGAGLDNEAAGLIANTAFGQDPSKTSLVETGDSVILVRTEEVFEAEQDALSELSDGLQRSLDGLVQTDIASAVVITLSETHGLELNAAGVQQILMGQTVR